MTLSVDAARAAFNSSYATLSVKRDIARFCTPFCDWEPPEDYFAALAMTMFDDV